MAQFSEETREIEYFKFIISNYIKFMFITEAKSQGKDCAEEIFANTVIHVHLPDFIKEIYTESYYSELHDEAVWLRNDSTYAPKMNLGDDFWDVSIDFNEMDSTVAEFTSDDVYEEGSLEGSENLEEARKAYIDFVIDAFVKEMLIRDYATMIPDNPWEYVDDIVSLTFTYISECPSCVSELYPLEWVEESYNFS